MQPSTSPIAYRLDLSVIDARHSLYITDELGELLNSTNIGFLVRISEGLFIAASTVVRFLKPSPTLQFQEVRSDGLSGLDSLYRLIMMRAMRDITLPHEQDSFHDIIMTIILASA